MNKVLDFILKALHDAETDTPSTKRLVYFTYAILGILCVLEAIGICAALLIPMTPDQRFEAFKMLLSFSQDVLLIGFGTATGGYVVGKAVEARRNNTSDEQSTQ